MHQIRLPSVAGAFYEGKAEMLRAQIEYCFRHKLGPRRIPSVNEEGQRKIVGLVCPHAGYVYSGPIAANAYFELALDGRPETVIILGPNHRGNGNPLATTSEGFWRTPLGDAEVDSETANTIINESQLVDIDRFAHLNEHSIEVQLPFLQYLYGPKFKFVPICFRIQDLLSATEVGKSIAAAVLNKNAVVIASSDMTHYEPRRNAIIKDMNALRAVEATDEKRFYSSVEKLNVSACGYGPIAALIVAANEIGARQAKLLCYKTSGDITGDYSSVVGYAALSFTK